MVLLLLPSLPPQTGRDVIRMAMVLLFAAAVCSISITIHFLHFPANSLSSSSSSVVSKQHQQPPLRSTTSPSHHPPPPQLSRPLVDNNLVKLELLNREPFNCTYTQHPPKVIKYFYTHPLAKLVSRKQLQEQYRVYYQRQDHATLFEFYNPKYQPYRGLFALDDASALLLASRYEDIHPDFRTTMPLARMKMVLNKHAFSNWLVESGFGPNVPKLYTTKMVAEILIGEQHKGELFPLVVKLASNTTSSFGVFVAHNATELRAILADDSRVPAGREYFVQEFVQGSRERVVHVVAINGRLVRMVCHERELETATIYQFISNPNKWRKTPPSIPLEQCHLDLFERLIAQMQFNGIGNFDIKVSAGSSSVVKIFEFNPRVPGTVLRDARLMGEFFCAMQWNGNGVLNPDRSVGGCVQQHNASG